MARVPYNGGTQLKVFEVNEEIFNKILYDYEACISIEPLDEYYCGYKGKKDKNIIVFNGVDQLICKEYILNGYCHNIEECTDWKQCRIRKVENAVTEVTDSLTGGRAWMHIYCNILEKEYSKDEIKNILNSFQREEHNIFHYYPTEWLPSNEIVKISNCYYYDINSAYMDALSEMFPKCKYLFEKMFKERKKNPINKKYANYFCGCLCTHGYRKTFNWITNRTHDLLFEMMDKTGGNLLYANTDGYFINNPNNILKGNTELGQFKLELTAGDVYFYRDKNYYIMQYENDKKEIEYKGSALCSIRKDIDLKNNVVVHYNIKLHPTLRYRYADNIKKEILSNGKKSN